ncbi:unnamed protein product [Tilletia controversa]|uniref:Uncharacterized protein n=1 Tax=Tilletia controversa TaxID=13291 RepID=A0A8X7MUY1_9BASI|nr:hypothetical protein CF328_g7441 [Tilletia controversa]KAE8250051.1 hypothetical protein A4X06_0g2947 [Tilletia controversa]CAD6918343.1 unnamed protein product [Tilletia controversa]CAD6920726.1 unnamed protein product [Tilletia controversa]CAD6941406.1 unnamed protein product [Tilletia controversa]
MAWLPASELPTISSSPSSSGVVQHVHPVLAFSFGKDLFFLHLVKGRRQIHRAGAGRAGTSNSRASRRSQANGGSPDSSLADTSVSYEDHLGLQEEMALVHTRTIADLQWLNPDLLLILDAEGLNLLDLRVRRRTERQRLPDFKAVTQRWDTEGVSHPVRPPAASHSPGSPALGKRDQPSSTASPVESVH